MQGHGLLQLRHEDGPLRRCGVLESARSVCHLLSSTRQAAALSYFSLRLIIGL
jgi:hypothetical protein